MALTDIAIRNAKASNKPVKMPDERSLYLLLNPNGSKCWRFDFRFGGKRKLIPAALKQTSRVLPGLWPLNVVLLELTSIFLLTFHFSFL